MAYYFLSSNSTDLHFSHETNYDHCHLISDHSYTKYNRYFSSIHLGSNILNPKYYGWLLRISQQNIFYKRYIIFFKYVDLAPSPITLLIE